MTEKKPNRGETTQRVQRGTDLTERAKGKELHRAETLRETVGKGGDRESRGRGRNRQAQGHRGILAAGARDQEPLQGERQTHTKRAGRGRNTETAGARQRRGDRLGRARQKEIESERGIGQRAMGTQRQGGS